MPFVVFISIPLQKCFGKKKDISCPFCYYNINEIMMIKRMFLFFLATLMQQSKDKSCDSENERYVTFSNG